jgi:hypothetical protein
MNEKERQQQTANDISALINDGSFTAVKMICNMHSVAYMVEVYRLLSKENKDKLLSAIENKLM